MQYILPAWLHAATDRIADRVHGECALQRAALIQVALVASRSDDERRLRSLLTDTIGEHVYFLGAFEAIDAADPPVACVICHRQSAVSQVPELPANLPSPRVVVLSDNHSEAAVVGAFEAGADYYFNIDESDVVLGNRLLAAMRYHERLAPQHLVVQPFVFDLQKHALSKDGKRIDLSPKEYEFAYYLFANRSRVVTNDELMTSVWTLPPSMDTRRIDTAACRVRRKIGLDGSSGWHLKRLRKVGYQLRAVPVESPATALSSTE